MQNARRKCFVKSNLWRTVDIERRGQDTLKPYRLLLPVWRNRKQCNGLGRLWLVNHITYFSELIKSRRYKSATKTRLRHSPDSVAPSSFARI